MSQIQSIIESYLERQFKGNKENDFGNRVPDPTIPYEMIDPERSSSDNSIPWRPIESTVKDDELKELESEIGFEFPSEYKELLKWKHFYEVYLDDPSISILSHLLGRWSGELLSMNRVKGLTKHLLDQKLWYFADFEDYGLLMFYCNHDGREPYGSVLFVDHENPYEYYVYARDLLELLQHYSEYSNRFIEKLNSRE